MFYLNLLAVTVQRIYFNTKNFNLNLKVEADPSFTVNLIAFTAANGVTAAPR